MIDSDKQYRALMLLDDGKGGQPAHAELVQLDFQLPFGFDATRMSPSNFVGLTRYFRPRYEQKGQQHEISSTPEDNPGFVFQSSTDNGHSWTRGNVDEFFREFNETVLILDVDKRDKDGVVQPGVTNIRNSGIFNSAVSWANFYVAPISPTRAVVYCTVPYLEVTAGPPENPDVWEMRGKIKIGTLAMNGAVSNISVLADDIIQNTGNQCAGAISVKGGAVLKYLDLNGSLYMIFADGASYVVGPNTGGVGWATGGLNGFGVGRLDMVFYDYEYAIYESLDRGVNWSRKGYVTKYGTPPSGDTNFLTNYYTVTHLRENGVPVGPTETAPWISNSFYKPPV